MCNPKAGCWTPAPWRTQRSQTCCPAAPLPPGSCGRAGRQHTNLRRQLKPMKSFLHLVRGRTSSLTPLCTQVPAYPHYCFPSLQLPSLSELKPNQNTGSDSPISELNPHTACAPCDDPQCHPMPTAQESNGGLVTPSPHLILDSCPDTSKLLKAIPGLFLLLPWRLDLFKKLPGFRANYLVQVSFSLRLIDKAYLYSLKYTFKWNIP